MNMSLLICSSPLLALVRISASLAGDTYIVIGIRTALETRIQLLLEVPYTRGNGRDKVFSLGNGSVIQIWNSDGDTRKHSRFQDKSTGAQEWEVPVFFTGKWIGDPDMEFVRVTLASTVDFRTTAQRHRSGRYEGFQLGNGSITRYEIRPGGTRNILALGFTV